MIAGLTHYIGRIGTSFCMLDVSGNIVPSVCLKSHFASLKVHAILFRTHVVQSWEYLIYLFPENHAAQKAAFEKKIEGMSSNIAMLEKQISDLKAQYKEERAETESKYATSIKKVEGDLAAANNKVRLP